MARSKPVDTQPMFVAIDLAAPLLPATYEDALGIEPTLVARDAARRGRAARDRPRPTAGADRGHPPVGSPPPADLCGRPAGVSVLPRRDAPRRLHQPDVGDRPDPHPPPNPRFP